MKTPTTALAEHPFFLGFPAQYLPVFAECATQQHFRPHQQLFEHGHDADKFYLITGGEVAIETGYVPGGAVTVQTLGQGEALGWSWLYPPYEWHFSARAVTGVDAIVFDAARLRQAAADDKSFGFILAMRVGLMLAERLHHTRSRLLRRH